MEIARAAPKFLSGQARTRSRRISSSDSPTSISGLWGPIPGASVKSQPLNNTHCWMTRGLLDLLLAARAGNLHRDLLNFRATLGIFHLDRQDVIAEEIW